MPRKTVNKRVLDFESMFTERMDEFQARLEQVTSASDRSATNTNDRASENLKSLSLEFQDFRQFISTEISFVKEELLSVQQRIDQQEARADEAEQYSRRNCLLLHGVKEDPAENLYSKVIQTVNTTLQVELSMDDIDRCHRLGPVRRSAADIVTSGNRPIIIKFVRFHVRDCVCRSRKLLKGTKMLVTESLTAARKELLNLARDRLGVRNVWTQEGRIVVLDKNKKKITVATKADLNVVILGLSNS